jgi:hypothetical protein
MLAGLGIARLLRWTPPPRKLKLAISAALICLAFADTLHPELLGRRAPVEFRTLALRRWEQGAREFFETLEELGNRGPVVEVPSGPPWESHREVSRTVLNAYHHRPTSGCHNSVIPPEVRRVRALTDRLPAADALRELRSLGFTTLVVHGGPPLQKPFRALAGQGELLEEVHATFRMAAYSISP